MKNPYIGKRRLARLRRQAKKMQARANRRAGKRLEELFVRLTAYDILP